MYIVGAPQPIVFLLYVGRTGLATQAHGESASSCRENCVP